MDDYKDKEGNQIYCENPICDWDACTERTRVRRDRQGTVDIFLCGQCAQAWDMAEVVSPEVIVIVEGGLVQGIEKNRDDISVSVRDYDAEGTNDEGDDYVKTDKDGKGYCETIW